MRDRDTRKSDKVFLEFSESHSDDVTEVQMRSIPKGFPMAKVTILALLGPWRTVLATVR